MVTTGQNRVASTLDSVFRPETATTPGWRGFVLLRLLAQGEPVSLDTLAAAHGQPVQDVRRALAVSPDIEYDEQDRIVGAALTLRPTPHRFEIDGRVLYTWCAMDTLVYPRLVERSARVTSPCQATGTPVRLTVGDTTVTDIDPPEALISLVTPDDLTSVRTAFCNHVHFFARAEVARPWLNEHPGASVLPIAEAYDLARDLTTSSCPENPADTPC